VYEESVKLVSVYEGVNDVDIVETLLLLVGWVLE
jgi:hypothetical protein